MRTGHFDTCTCVKPARGCAGSLRPQRRSPAAPPMPPATLQPARGHGTGRRQTRCLRLLAQSALRASRVDGCMHGAHEDGRRRKPSLLLLFSTERVQRRALALRHLRRRCALSRRRPPRGGRCARSGEQLPDRACVCGRQHPLREGRRLPCLAPGGGAVVVRRRDAASRRGGWRAGAGEDGLCLCSRGGQQAARRRNPPLELVALGQLARRQADAVRLERRRVVAAEDAHLWPLSTNVYRVTQRAPCYFGCSPWPR